MPLVVHGQALLLLTGLHKIVELPQIHVLMRIIKAARLSFNFLSIITLAQRMDSQKLIQDDSMNFWHYALASSWRLCSHKGQDRCAASSITHDTGGNCLSSCAACKDAETDCSVLCRAYANLGYT